MAKKKRGAAAVKKTGRRGRRGRAAAPAVPAAGGRALESLRGAHMELVQQRNMLDQQISVIEQALQAMGTALPRRPGRPPGRPGRRAGGGPRPGSLKDFITQVMTGGGVMTVKDITDAVMRAGYQTRNQTLAKSVGIALTEMDNVDKVARGQFRLK